MAVVDWFIALTQTAGFEAFVRYMITLLGSFSMYLFSFAKGFEGATARLRQLFPQRRKVFYDRLDFVLVVMLGSAIGTIFFRPGDALQALAAGFGWVGAVNVLFAKRSGGTSDE